MTGNDGGRVARRQRRYWWLRLLLPVWVEHLVVLVSTGLSLFSVLLILAHQGDQQAGRRFAIKALCGVAQGTIDAGEDQLRQAGLPPSFERRYAYRIQLAVEREAGATDLVGPDGRLDCARLLEKSRAGAGR